MKFRKYFVYKKQFSLDDGETWEDTNPLETTTSGDPIATYDTLAECESGTVKFYAAYSDGTSYMIDCTSTGDTLTSADTRGHSTAYSAMTEAYIGDCVNNIGAYALDGCSSLTSITVSATTPPTLGSGALYNTSNCPIYVPSASVDAYKAATNWSSYSSRIQAIP